MTTKTTDVLQTRLEVDDKANAKLKKAANNVGDMENKSSKSLAKLKGSYLAAAAAIAGFIVIGKKLVALAAEQERVETRLKFALAQHGLVTQKATQSVLDYASALQRQTIYGDEAIINVQTMLVQLGGLTGDKLKEATRLTLDFASAMGVDLKAAAVLMGKAAAGETSSLSRYGIILDEGIPKQEKFMAVLTLLQKKFGGTSKAETDTLYGAISQAQNAFSDLGEEMGRADDGWLKTSIQSWGRLAGRMADTVKQGRMLQGGGPIADKLKAEIKELTVVAQAYAEGSDLFSADFYRVTGQIAQKRSILSSLTPEQLGISPTVAGVVEKKKEEAAPPAGANALAAYLAGVDAITQARIEIQTAGLEKDSEFNQLHIDAVTENIQAEKDLQLEMSNFLINEQQKRVDGQVNANALLKDSYTSLYSSVSAALSSFEGTQKIGFLMQRGAAAATAFVHGMAGAAAAIAPPPIGLGPIAGLALSKKLAIMTKLNVAAIMAASFAGAGNAATGVGSSGGSANFLGSTSSTSRPKVTVVLQGGMENMLESINEFVQDSDFELIATTAGHAVTADALR